ncbi:MAG: hypothetical protein ABS36_15235 [Acidobacteria bacterium SCN 69-37]|nr:MAG: hypothetical protein ABS36_15235 [Acidobacteria bacterium SCN 69-37]
MPTRLLASLGTTIVAAVVLSAGVLVATPAQAQTAQVRYERALAREHAARRQANVTVASLRSIAVAYEQIVRRYPRSGYSDNALYQGAGVLQLAWERGGQTRDRDQALKMLDWLRREYPSSSLVSASRTRTTALNRPRTTTPARNASAAPARPRPQPMPLPASARAAEPPPEAVTPAAAPVTPPAATPTVAAQTPARAAADDNDDDTSARSTSALVAALAARRAAAAEEAAATPPPPARPAATPAASPATSRAPSSSAAPAERRAEPIALRGLSHTPLPRGDRLTLELSDETTFAISPASNDTLVLTVAEARAAAAILDAAASVRGSLIESLKLSNASDGLHLTVSLTDRNGQVRHSAFPLYGPTRLVFDFESSTLETTPQTVSSSAPAPVVLADAARGPSAPVPAAPAAATPTPRTTETAAAMEAPASDEPAAPTPAPPASIRGGYSLARQLGLGVSRIVIDPGHGGSDPGASANGVTESALVLDIALRLEKLLLDQPGFEVVLTRRTNEAVPLARRTAIANEESADLFLSIHANSSPRRETAGVETYFLNLATTPQAEAVAARENASSAEAMRTLPQLVRAITTNNKLAESRELAGMVQSSLVRQLRSRNRTFQDLGVKQAPFMVLIGAQMPSVLAEVAFLTNKTESTLLKQNAYKQRIAQALFDAVLQYRSSLKKVSPVATTAEGR